MGRLFRWIIGGILLCGFVMCNIIILAYSLTPVPNKDYQWYITIPVMLALLIGGAIALPIKVEK